MRNINNYVKEIYKAILVNKLDIIGDNKVKKVYKAGRVISSSLYKATVIYFAKLVGAKIVDEKE